MAETEILAEKKMYVASAFCDVSFQVPWTSDSKIRHVWNEAINMAYGRT